MTALVIDHECFDGLDGALADIRARGLWPTSFALDEGLGAPMHWHTDEVWIYLVAGRTSVSDGAGNWTGLAAGSRLRIPPRVLHQEGPVDEPLQLIVALPEPRSQADFLKAFPPEELPSE